MISTSYTCSHFNCRNITICQILLPYFPGGETEIKQVAQSHTVGLVMVSEPDLSNSKEQYLFMSLKREAYVWYKKGMAMLPGL